MSEGRTPPETVYANNSNPDVDAISGPTPPFGFPDQGLGGGDRPAITMTHYAGGDLLPMALQEDRQEISPADRGGMGICGTWWHGDPLLLYG